MENHEIDLNALGKIIIKNPRHYKSRERNKKGFKHKAIKIGKKNKYAPLMHKFRDIYYKEYKKFFSEERFAMAVGEYLTNICEYKLVYRPNKNTVFKNHPFIKPPKNDDPVLYLDEPAPDLSDDKPEVSYEISGKIGIFDINLKVKKTN